MMATSFYDREKRGMINDSMILDAFLYADNGTTLIPESDITGVTFTVMLPTDTEDSPSVSSQSGDIVGVGHGQYVVDGSFNGAAGAYRGIATFSYTDGTITGLTKSVVCNYEIEDPFQVTGSSPADPYVDQAWTKLMDCFDSDQGGPWLRDQTLDVFDKYKMRSFLPEVMLTINTQEMPFSDYTESTFPYTTSDGGALIAQGLLVASIRHLIRSYTEQPDIVNSPVAWESRLKYQQAWKLTYDVEADRFNYWLKRWKLRAYDISHGSMLVSSKAGRLMGGPFRSRGYGWRGY